MTNRVSDMSDARKLPERFPSDLREVILGIIVTERRPGGETAPTCFFSEKNAADWPAFWDEVYDLFGEDPAGRVIISVRKQTPMSDQDGKPYFRSSFIVVEDGKVFDFSAEDARYFLEGAEDTRNEVPSASFPG